MLLCLTTQRYQFLSKSQLSSRSSRMFSNSNRQLCWKGQYYLVKILYRGIPMMGVRKVPKNKKYIFSTIDASFKRNGIRINVIIMEKKQITDIISSSFFKDTKINREMQIKSQEYQPQPT